MKRFTVMLAILALAACGRHKEAGGADTARGKQLINKYGCAACHQIPGMPGPQGSVGPPLDRIGSRSFIGGKFQNTPEIMTQWLQNPQAMDPASSMPNLGVTPADARDITTYLEALK